MVWLTTWQFTYDDNSTKTELVWIPDKSWWIVSPNINAHVHNIFQATWWMRGVVCGRMLSLKCTNRSSVAWRRDTEGDISKPILGTWLMKKLLFFSRVWFTGLCWWLSVYIWVASAWFNRFQGSVHVRLTWGETSLWALTETLVKTTVNILIG